MKLKTLALLPLLFVATHAMAADANKVDLSTDKQKLSYIFGIQAGQSLRHEKVDLDLDAFKAGVADMMAGRRPQLDKADAEKVITAYEAKKAKALAAIMNKKQAESEAYMKKNAKLPGVVTTKDGLQYQILKKGDGAVPTRKDKVIVNYKGTLLNGKVFDSSYKRGKPVTIAVDQVIPGWQEALTKMHEGGKWRIVVPANLAYGPRGAGKLIGPNETLIFDIDLIAITNK